MGDNRSDVIRTRDLYVPNVALYQAEPHSDDINFCLDALSAKTSSAPAKELRIEDLNLY